jgi:hypothetical protein
MKILVSPLSQEQLDTDTTGAFSSPGTDKLFNYCIEFEENDYLTITDSLKRVMPLDYTEINDFARLFTALDVFQKALTDQRNASKAELLDALSI